MKNRREISRDRMHRYYKSWEVSGKSIKGFAKDHGIPSSTFYYWCKKFSDKEGTVDDNHAGFASLAIEMPDNIVTTDQPTAIVRFPTGVSVEWYGSNTSELICCLSSKSQ